MQHVPHQATAQVELRPPGDAGGPAPGEAQPSLRAATDQGLQQLHDVIFAVKRLFAASQQAPPQPAELEQLKLQYLNGTAGLRSTIKLCHSLHSQQMQSMPSEAAGEAMPAPDIVL